MGKRLRILIGVTAVIVVGIIAWALIAVRSAPPEPVYKGKPLSYWLQGYNLNSVGTNRPNQAEADAAMYYVGTNGIPTLLRMLLIRDSPLKIKMMSWACRIPYVRLHYQPDGVRTLEAVNGMLKLGSQAWPAVPDLVKILNGNSSSNLMEYSLIILANTGPPAKKALPTLLRIAAETNEYERKWVMYALGQIHANPEEVVPVLTTALHDPSPAIRANAAFGLGPFGHDAKSSVPELVAILSEPVPGSNSAQIWSGIPYRPGQIPCARSFAEDSLREIDPETYAKVVTNEAPKH